MAIQFARLEYVSRSTGGNACRKSAYNERSAVECDRTGQLFNFTKKTDNVFHEVLLPKGAHEKFKYSSVLWNEAEKWEKRINSQVCKDVVLALPKEKCVTLEHKIKIAKEFIEQEFVSKGLAAQLDIHSPHEENENWHAHVLVTTRYFDETGETFGKKARDLDPVVRFKKVKEAENLGLKFKEFQEKYAIENNLDFKVDDIGIISQEHLGPVRLRKNGTDLIKSSIETSIENKRRVFEAESVLDSLTKTKSVFGENDVDHFLKKHGVEELNVDLKNNILKSEFCLKLLDTTTKTFTGLYTTQKILDEEKFLNRLASSFKDKEFKSVNLSILEKISKNFTLDSEQENALKKACSQESLVVIEGRAGTGKSHLLKAIKESFEKTTPVMALAPTHSVAKDLLNDGFEAHTVHSFLFKVKNEKINILKNSVLLVDESAMVQNSALIELLKISKNKNLKTILVGDDRQLLSVERGGAFELIKDKIGSVTLSEIRRQKTNWQKEVSKLLSDKKTYEAVQLLNENKAIHFEGCVSDSIDALIKDFSKETDFSKVLVLSFRNQMVDDLNEKIQNLRLKRGEISSDFYNVMTPTGVKNFAKGDNVIFSITNKKMDLTNGDSGVIVELDEKKCVVENDKKERKIFDPNSYQGLRLNYASTIHKSQGKTVEKTYILHDSLMGNRLSYVALSRQQTDLKLYVSKNQTKSLSHLSFQMEKGQKTALSLHFLSEQDLDKTLQKTINSQTIFGHFKNELKSNFENIKTRIQDKFHTNDDFYEFKNSNTSSYYKVEKADYILDKKHSSSKESGAAKNQETLTINSVKKYDARLRDFKLENEERLNILTKNTYDIALKLYGPDFKKTSKSLRYGSKGSVEIFTTGPNLGRYSNYETNVHGNVYTLIKEAMGHSSFSQTVLWAKEYLNSSDPSFNHLEKSTRFEKSTPQKNEDKWMQISAPTSVFPNVQKDKFLSYMTKDKTLKDFYKYTDEEGKTLGFVVRLEDKQGSKITPTLTYHHHESGLEAWRWKGFGENRPLFNLKDLSDQNKAPVLIVEGEKTAVAASKLFKDHVVVTWSGGAGAFKKTDFKPLKNRDISIWPDNDQAGFKCALGLKEHLLKDFKTKAVVVDVPDVFEKKWDLADSMPKGFDEKDLKTLLKTNISDSKLLEKSGGIFNKDLDKTREALSDVKNKLEVSDAKKTPTFDFKGVYKNWSKEDICERTITKNYDQLVLPKSGFSGLVENVAGAYMDLVKSHNLENFDQNKIKNLSIFTSLVFQEHSSKTDTLSVKSLEHIARAFDHFEKSQKTTKTFGVVTQTLDDLLKQTRLQETSSPSSLGSTLTCLKKETISSFPDQSSPSQIPNFEKTMSSIFKDYHTFRHAQKDFDQTREFPRFHRPPAQLERGFERTR